MKSTKVFLLCLAIILSLCIVATSIFFNISLVKQTEQIVGSDLEEQTKQDAISFEIKLHDHIKEVRTATNFFASSDWKEIEHQKFLLFLVKNKNLLYCTMASANGDFIAHDGERGNIAKEEFFIRAMNAEANITDPIPLTKDTTASVIIVTAPIIEGGKVIGTLSYVYPSDAIGTASGLNFSDANAQAFIVKQNGQIIIGDTLDFNGETNIVEYLHRNHTEVSTHQGISNTEGSFLHSLDDGNQEFYVHYYYLNINDWYFFSILPVEVATETIMNVSKEQQRLVIVIAVCILLYILIVIFLRGLQRKNTDELTGAPSFENFKRQTAKIIKENPLQRYLIIKFDVKNFKLINRLYSFDEGDRFIKNIATALKAILPKDTIFARSNADSFVMLFHATSELNIDRVHEKFLVSFRELMGDDFKAIVRFSSGHYMTTEEDAIMPNIAEIFEKLNFAHQYARQLNGEAIERRNNQYSNGQSLEQHIRQVGYNAIVSYNEILERESIFQKTIEDKMEGALLKGEFILFLQPKYRVSDESICGAESLIRWQVCDGFIFHPSDFIPIFEKNGFIVKIDMHMYELAVKKIKYMIDNNIPPCTISINFSRFHLNNENFVAELITIADKYNVPHKYLEIELTESVVFDNTDIIIKLLDDLHSNDFTLAMDDFGSGYSSLGLLKNLEIDIMKIDQTFFQKNIDEKRANTVIQNIINLAHDLGIKTVAEGVETKTQVQMLRNSGCDMIQGFYYAKPMSADKFIEMYTKDA